MKIVSVLLLCLATVSCQTQYAAPVNIAFEVYKGCIHGTLQSGEYPVSERDIKPFIEDLDQLCINWTAIWTPKLIERETFLTDDEAKRLDVRRLELLNKMNAELHQYALKHNK
jgi:hypothetical protein